MKVYILLDYDTIHIFGVYAEKEEAERDKNRFYDKMHDVRIVERELVARELIK